MPLANILRSMLPAWALEGDGGAVAMSLALVIDDHAQRFRESVQAQFPSYAVPGALDIIGRERGIPKGRTETDAHFIARVKKWRTGHRRRGTAFALLEQVSEYWGGMTCRTVDNNQTRNEHTAAGVESYTFVTGWNWDGHPEWWSRFWLLLYAGAEHPEIKAWLTLGAGAWGSLDPTVNKNKTVGQQGVTTDDVAAIRRLFASPTRDSVPWKPAWTRIERAIMVLGDTAVAITPAGGWGDMYARFAAEKAGAFRFWEMT